MTDTLSSSCSFSVVTPVLLSILAPNTALSTPVWSALGRSNGANERSSVITAMSDPSMLAGITSAASDRSHRYTLDWLTIASSGTAADVGHLTTLPPAPLQLYPRQIPSTHYTAETPTTIPHNTILPGTRHPLHHHTTNHIINLDSPPTPHQPHHNTQW